MPEAITNAVARIGENCEPALCSVLFMAGAGGSLRAGATDNPVLLTRSVQAGHTRVTSGGAPVFIWPGGGITYMVDVAHMPAMAFGTVPTPALVAPIEFSLTLADYVRLGGHVDRVRRIEDVVRTHRPRAITCPSHGFSSAMSAIAALLPDGRLHLQHGPIDCLCQAWGAPDRFRPGSGKQPVSFPAFWKHYVTSCHYCAQPCQRRSRKVDCSGHA